MAQIAPRCMGLHASASRGAEASTPTLHDTRIRSDNDYQRPRVPQLISSSGRSSHGLTAPLVSAAQLCTN